VAERTPKTGSRSHKKDAAKKPAAKKAGASKGASSAKKPPPDLPGRIDGLRGWLDQIERKQSRMTYALVAGLLIALATAGVALYLGIKNHQDAATTGDLNKVKDDVSQIRTQAQADTQTQVKTLSTQIAALQKQVAAAQATAQQAKTAAARAPATTLPSLTPTTPTPTTTTPNNTGGNGNKNP